MSRAPVLLERCEVGRKTPLDGRLELAPESAAQLVPLGAEFAVVALGAEGVGRLETMACTCGKSGSAGATHLHHFAASPLFRDLTAGEPVRIELDEVRGALVVGPG
ncbi:MAG: hypothetical protein EXR95_02885 [Gemmatimonadetes bacterium]|nr:hypothetical protein [Gemmatimonadota bacterium]